MDYQLAKDRTRREIKTPVRYAQADLIAYALNTGEKLESQEPATYEEACQSKEREQWLAAMKKEMFSLQKNATWNLVEKPYGKKVIGFRGIFKKKPRIPGVEPVRNQSCCKRFITGRGY